jgi:hypothetical protein
MVADWRSTLRPFPVFRLLFARSMVICGAAHGGADLPEPGPARSHPGAEGAGFVQFAEEGGAAAEAVELLG